MLAEPMKLARYLPWVILLALPTITHSQAFQATFDLRVCLDFPRCKAKIQLDEGQKKFVDSLAQGIPCGASPEAVAGYFGRPAHHQTPPADMLGFGKGWRATWLLESTLAPVPNPDSVDVDFINAKAYARQWWFNKHRSKVEVMCRLKK